MTLLPIVDRELRVAARWKATHRIRMWVGGLAMLVGGWTMFTLSMVGFGNMLGSALFASLTWIATLYCYLGALYCAADSLSAEKREGTLGLLFLTDLKGFDVVLGKLAGNALHWTYGLLAMFPVLAISWLLGGVELLQFWLTILALLNLLFFALAVGMWVSSISRFERKSMLGTLVLLWLFAYGPGIAGFAIEQFYENKGLADQVRWLCPSHARDMAGSVRGYFFNVEYWGSLGLTHLMGWIMLGLASRCLSRNWQDQVPSVAASRRSERGRQLVLGNAKARGRFRQWALNKNPFFWLACRYRRSRFLILLATIAMGLYYVWAFLDNNNRVDPFESIIPFIVLHGLLKIWFVFETCRRFVDDRQSGALELILCTPCGVKDIVRGQWMALGRYFIVAVVMILALDLFVLFVHLTSDTIYLVESSQRYVILLFTAGVLVFWADLAVLGWMGMWLGLRAKHTFAAVGRSVFTILILPWLIYGVLVTVGFSYFFYFMSLAGGTGPNDTSFLARFLPEILIGSWTLLALLTDAVFGFWARSQLFRRFREQVAMQYAPPLSPWLWRRRNKGSP